MLLSNNYFTLTICNILLIRLDDLGENYMHELTQEIVENPETVYVESENDQTLIQLIELINTQSID